MTASSLVLPHADAASDGVDAPARPSFREVYDTQWRFVWKALRALGVRHDDLEDQVHEVFLVVHRQLPEFEGRSQITTWLWAISTRVASDFRRRAYVRRESLTDAPPEPPNFAPGPDAAIEQAQRRKVLDWVLGTMPDEQRVVFVLFELDGLTAEAIAPLVGCSVNTVYSRIRLGRKHFERAVARARAGGVR